MLVNIGCQELPPVGVYGCIDENACSPSYDENATIDDGSCLYPEEGENCLGEKIGCIDILGCNFDSIAEVDDGSCIYGCNDELACNYDETSACDASCVYAPAGQDCDGLLLGCTDDSYLEYYTQGYVADLDDGSCQTLAVFGCMDPAFCTFNPQANLDDNSCSGLTGCNDPTACNFDPNADCDDGSCSGLLGCINPIATNYNSQATCDDGSCVIYVQAYLDDGATPQQIINQGGYPADSLWGKIYQGGRIFHYDIALNKGLIASFYLTSTFDIVNSPNWYCRAGGEGMFLGTSEAVFTGQSNTSTWNSSVSGGDWPSNGWLFGTSNSLYFKYTSRVLTHGQDLAGLPGGSYIDWYVPSIDELNLIHVNLILNGYETNTPSYSMISSSEDGPDLVQRMAVNGPSAGIGYTAWKYNINPNYVFGIWPIRTF